MRNSSHQVNRIHGYTLMLLRQRWLGASLTCYRSRHLVFDWTWRNYKYFSVFMWKKLGEVICVFSGRNEKLKLQCFVVTSPSPLNLLRKSCFNCFAQELVGDWSGRVRCHVALYAEDSFVYILRLYAMILYVSSTSRFRRPRLLTWIKD